VERLPSYDLALVHLTNNDNAASWLTDSGGRLLFQVGRGSEPSANLFIFFTSMAGFVYLGVLQPLLFFSFLMQNNNRLMLVVIFIYKP
jgi:hypothetical protein